MSAWERTAAYKLSLMGASVTEVSPDRAISLLKMGLRVADAIVIESVEFNALFADGAMTALKLAKAVHDLPDHVTMPTGTRWNGIPIAVLVGDQGTADMIVADPRLRYVLPCSTERMSFAYYEYVDPWPAIYAKIDDAVLHNTILRLQQMESVGHRFETVGGRWLRMLPPSLDRKGGSRPEVQTELYEGFADRMLRRKRQIGADWNGRDVLLIEREAIQRDLDLYERLVRRPHEEREMQQFYRQRPYVLGAGAHETTDHPAFYVEGRNRPMRPDFVQHSCNDAIDAKPARVIEIKTNDAQSLTRSGLDWHWSRTPTKALAQVRRYAAHMGNPKYRAQMESLFDEAPKSIEKMVISGMSGQYDRHRLDLARSYDDDVKFLGYDEAFASALDRYSSAKHTAAALPPMGTSYDSLRRRPRWRDETW